MTSLRHLLTQTRRGQNALAESTRVFAGDVARGFFEVGHSTLALVGLVLLVAGVFAASRDDVRHEAEVFAFGWLQSRHELRLEPLPEVLAPVQSVSLPTAAPMPSQRDAAGRATAADIKDLTQQQANIAQWLSRRYKVAPEPVSRLVKEAWHAGGRVNVDPTLILAVMAIESNFNPFAQSPVGAQGLMQVMTTIHNDKYQPFGGRHAAFDPVTNLRVGIQVLKECITRAGSVEAGLRYYVGAANLPLDGGYANKVLSERAHILQVASGRSVPLNAPLNTKPSGNTRPVVKDPMIVDPQEAEKGPEQLASTRRAKAA